MLWWQGWHNSCRGGELNQQQGRGRKNTTNKSRQRKGSLHRIMGRKRKLTDCLPVVKHAEESRKRAERRGKTPVKGEAEQTQSGGGKAKRKKNEKKDSGGIDHWGHREGLLSVSYVISFSSFPIQSPDLLICACHQCRIFWCTLPICRQSPHYHY